MKKHIRVVLGSLLFVLTLYNISVVNLSLDDDNPGFLRRIYYVYKDIVSDMYLKISRDPNDCFLILWTLDMPVHHEVVTKFNKKTIDSTYFNRFDIYYYLIQVMT